MNLKKFFEKEKTNENCILATDFSIVDISMDQWRKEREKKGQIYVSFSEYILCLEDSLEIENDSYKKYLIEQEIKKLKKEQKKYYVPSILEESKLEPYREDETLEIKKTKCLTKFLK